ncbi:aspartyl protease family protein [Candidatus Leptofilum sp.]|uniref:aspartyl protease family protein n=1 Tax=Candidatus Leptofilum sp. TaxID=3241576 RepID=UPI003B5A975D
MNVQFEYDRSYLPPAPVVTLTVHGYSDDVQPATIQAMVDSGADGTMLPTAVLTQIEASYVDSVRMSGVTGTVERRDRYRVRLQIGDIVIKGIDAIAIKSENEGLIGRDVLNQLIVTLNGLAAELTIADQ